MAPCSSPACGSCLCILTPHTGVQAFEDTIGKWMEQFHSLLTYSNPALALGERQRDREGPLDAAKAAVCANINLYLEINDEEFGPFVETFVRDVWTQLVTVTLAPGQVGLASGMQLSTGACLQTRSKRFSSHVSVQLEAVHRALSTSVQCCPQAVQTRRLL